MTYTKGNDSNDESEESGEGTEDTKDEVGTESEDEGDQGKTSGNRSKDEGEGQVAEDVLRGDGSAGKTSDEVDWISERRSRTLSTETISPITNLRARRGGQYIMISMRESRGKPR